MVYHLNMNEKEPSFYDTAFLIDISFYLLSILSNTIIDHHGMKKLILYFYGMPLYYKWSIDTYSK